MRNIFLLIISILLFPYEFNVDCLQAAEPEEIQYLMNEPASLFDIGLIRLNPGIVTSIQGAAHSVSGNFSTKEGDKL